MYSVRYDFPNFPIEVVANKLVWARIAILGASGAWFMAGTISVKQVSNLLVIVWSPH